MSFSMFDNRRVQMANEGFVVARDQIDKKTGKEEEEHDPRVEANSASSIQSDEALPPRTTTCRSSQKLA
jgi:hypothetical protein